MKRSDGLLIMALVCTAPQLKRFPAVALALVFVGLSVWCWMHGE